MSNWMITASGAEYHMHGAAAMTVDGCPVRVEDIAHHLALINRFHGATSRPYSVAEHSLLVSEIAQRAGQPMIVQMAALMHDAHEAYVSDLSSPAKAAVNWMSTAAGGTRAWDSFEMGHAKNVRRHFGLLTVFTSHRHALRVLDLAALATERRDLINWHPGTHAGWSVLGDDATDDEERIKPIGWIDLNTPERAAMPWQEWRDRFLDRFDELSFGLTLQTTGAAALQASCPMPGPLDHPILSPRAFPRSAMHSAPSSFTTTKASHE